MKNTIRKTIKREIDEKNLIYPFIRAITGRERAVLELRAKGKPLSFIGKKFGITRERVRQIEEKAKAKLDYQVRIGDKLAKKIKVEVNKVL